jgi:hypothetical protein
VVDVWYSRWWRAYVTGVDFSGITIRVQRVRGVREDVYETKDVEVWGGHKLVGEGGGEGVEDVMLYFEDVGA